MDDSQSSDVFSDSADYSTMMDSISYENLVSNTKAALSINIEREVHKSSFFSQFITILDDCHTCISQSLELIVHLLAKTDVQLDKLQEYLGNAVNLLQMLSNFFKIIVESISMSCCNMKTFPTTTCHILTIVFTHCKDSEVLYGNNVKGIEEHLKELFRTCHELQLTYLMILENHFIFDLTENEELNVLIDALEINLQIGEMVQALDVKTMAEQWKAYTVLCEKYSQSLSDKHIYQMCTKVLSTMIQKNIKMACEVNQDEKVIIRSLKVSSFIIKILLRMSNIFKHATVKNLEHIVSLLIYTYLNSNYSYLQLIQGKSQQFVDMMTTHVLNPTEALLIELLDEKLVNCVTQFDINKLDNEDILLGFILLIVSMMKSILKQTNKDFKIYPQKLIQSIFKILPKGHIWFNMGLRFYVGEKRQTVEQTQGLYEHLLLHTLAVTVTFSAEEMNALEQTLYESLLSSDCYAALFASNLWTLLARFSNRQHLTNQLLSLCKIFQKLEKNKLFSKSPQRIYLSYTIRRLFKQMHKEDKMKVYKHFNINDDRNVVLWSEIKISNLPESAQNNAEEIIKEKLKIEFGKLFTSSLQRSEEMYTLNNMMKLGATGNFTCDSTLADNTVTAWLRVCTMSKRTASFAEAKWYLDYMEGLVALTISQRNIFDKSIYVGKMLHVVSNALEMCKIELKLILIDVILDLLLHSYVYDDNRNFIDSLLVKIFKELLQADSVVKNKFFNTILPYRLNLENIFKVSLQDSMLQETWINYVENRPIKAIDLKEQLMLTMDMKFSHKCIEHRHVIELSDSSKKTSSNFELADIDTLFDAESDTEPACKKVKLNNNIEEIISRMESDTTLLANVKETVISCQYKTRIRDICEKLNNIIH